MNNTNEKLDLTKPFELATPVSGYKFRDTLTEEWIMDQELINHRPDGDRAYPYETVDSWFRYCEKIETEEPKTGPGLEYKIGERVLIHKKSENWNRAGRMDYLLNTVITIEAIERTLAGQLTVQVPRKDAEEEGGFWYVPLSDIRHYTEEPELDLTEPFSLAEPVYGYEFSDYLDTDTEWKQYGLIAHVPSIILPYMDDDGTTWKYCRKVEPEVKPEAEEPKPKTDFETKTTEQIVGMKVVRGRDWEWGNQDGGEGSIGTVIKGDDSDNWVSVEWDESKVINRYQHGADCLFDLQPAPEPELRYMTGKEALLMGNGIYFFMDEDGDIWGQMGYGSEWSVSKHKYCTRLELENSTEDDFSDIDWKKLKKPK